ncbi:hypothetical protein H175_ch4574 [Bacillus thuringiensis serovar thuringiensis str. IS5056]|nr:hypothetical protein CT43_CH4502 [Bacillus thuringiensis serovar chinensis CT-43]AGG03284.1 hypothetical protein H175_ch4574 [Bacillus thuringiensis serovar thuringiensis str. IS5056]
MINLVMIDFMLIPPVTIGILCIPIFAYGITLICVWDYVKFV